MTSTAPPALPPGTASPKRSRGRPKGSLSKVAASLRLGVHHFAFLRSVIYGIDLRTAWDRYLGHLEAPNDLRHLQAQKKHLVESVLMAANALNVKMDGALDYHLKALQIVNAEPKEAGAKTVISFEQWLEEQSFDAEEWGENELLEMYQEHVSTEAQPEAQDEPEVITKTAIDNAVNAVNYISLILAEKPKAQDPVELWFSKRLCKKLQIFGISNLFLLCERIKTYGYRWAQPIKGIGLVQSQKISIFLSSIDDPALNIPQHCLHPDSEAQYQPQVSYGIRPLEYFITPSYLLGEHGMLRSTLNNTLGAKDDREAINAWLNKYAQQPHTGRSYRKEVERFYLWCILCAKKSISDITTADCLQYREFLSDIPAQWIFKKPCPRKNALWRPFRDKLNISSQKQALTVVQIMYEGLCKAAYLIANPMHAVYKGFNFEPNSIQVQRSFEQAEWDFVIDCVSSIAHQAQRTRMRLLLELLSSTGLRASEIANATMGAISTFQVPGYGAQHVLQVRGKRNKTRQVPIAEDVYSLILGHLQSLNADPTDPGTPLVCTVLQENHPFKTIVDEQGNARRQLTASAIYQILKKHFKQCALKAPLVDLSSQHIEAASTHWLRHTFARQNIAEQVPLEIIQQVLGHSSLNTTTIYTSTEKSRAIAALTSARQRIKGH